MSQLRLPELRLKQGSSPLQVQVQGPGVSSPEVRRPSFIRPSGPMVEVGSLMGGRRSASLITVDEARKRAKAIVGLGEGWRQIRNNLLKAAQEAERNVGMAPGQFVPSSQIRDAGVW